MNLTIKQFQQYKTQFPALEVIGGMLYDTVSYTSAATTVLTFYNAVRASLDLGNMEVPSMLTNNKGFLIRAIRINFRIAPRSVARAATTNVTTGPIDDCVQLLNTGVFTLTIGQKDYAEFPLWMLPAGGGIYGQAGLDGDTADPGLTISWVTNGEPAVNNVYSLSQPLFISPMINFVARINWPAALTLANGNTFVQVLFDGDLMRPVQ